MLVTVSGKYELTEAQYFADPCPAPSLTQSLAKTLLGRTPLHMWHEHPRLNKDFEQTWDEKFDLGTAAHTILFGRGRTVAVADYSDYRKKEAREWRDETRLRGDTPLLQHQYDLAQEMVAKFRELVPHVDKYKAQKEVTIVADTKGVWLRAKVDWLADHHRAIIDYKTTAIPLERGGIHDYAFRQGWHIQAAMHEMILNYLDQKSGPRSHYFFLQETAEPYAVYRCELGNSMMESARTEIREAIQTFKACLDSGQWPGPSDEMTVITVPGWALRKHEESRLAAESIHGVPSQTGSGSGMALANRG